MDKFSDYLIDCLAEEGFETVDNISEIKGRSRHDVELIVAFEHDIDIKAEGKFIADIHLTETIGHDPAEIVIDFADGRESHIIKFVPDYEGMCIEVVTRLDLVVED